MIKKYFKLILLLVIVANYSYAQDNYIVLESGERVYSNKIKLRGSLNMGNAELETDNGKRYVVSYQVDSYFQKGILYKKGYQVGSEVITFFKLAEEGPKSNLYFKTVMNRYESTGMLEWNSVYYYTKTDSLMSPLKLKYELKDFADSPASMQLLSKAKTKRTIANTLYFTGSGLIIASMINFTSKDSNGKLTGALFFGGGAVFVIGAQFNRAKEKAKLQAARAYNLK